MALTKAQKRAKKLKKRSKNLQPKKTSNKDPFEKILSITPPASKKEFEEEHISEESEEFIEAKKEYKEYFSQFSKEKSNEERIAIAQSIYNEIHNGDYEEEDMDRLCEVKYQYLTYGLTKEEFDKYWEFEVNQDKIIGDLIPKINSAENINDILKSLESTMGDNVQQRYEGFLQTNIEDTTVLSVVRDFNTKLYSRVLEIKKPWVAGSGSVLTDKNEFKTQYDFDWAKERIGKDLVIFKKHIKDNCHNITKRKFYNNKLIEIAKDYIEKVEKIRMERLK